MFNFNNANFKQEINEIWKLALPIIIAELGIVLMGVADTAMLGHNNHVDVSAAGVANSVFFIFTVIGFGASMVISPMVAAANENQDKHTCHLLLKTGMLMGLVFATCISAILYYLAYHFEWFGQEEIVTQKARIYMYFTIPSVFPMLLFLSAKQFTDGLGFTKVAMILNIGALIFHVLLNYLMIFGKLGFPAWGLEGAAISTSISRFFMMFVLIIYIQKSKQFADFIQTPIKFSEILKALPNLIMSGLPAGMQYFFEVTAFALAAIMAGWISKEQNAAHMVAINLASMSFMVNLGLALAGSIRVGQAFGVQDHSKIRLSGQATLFLSMTWMLSCAVIFLIASEFLASLYLENKQVIQLAVPLIMLAGCFQLADGAQSTALSLLRGKNDVQFPTWVTLTAYWGIGLPLAYYLGFVLKMNTPGIWLGLWAGLSFSAIFLNHRFFKQQK